MATGGFVDDGSVNVDSGDDFADNQKKYFNKKTKLLYKIKKACGFPLNKPKKELTEKEKRSLQYTKQGETLANFDDPKEITSRKLGQIVDKSPDPEAKKEAITSSLTHIFENFYNYLCYSDLDKCIKNTYGEHIKNYTIVNSDRNIIKVIEDKDSELRSFILDDEGNIKDFHGKPVPEMSTDDLIKPYVVDENKLDRHEITRLKQLNSLIEIHNLVPVFHDRMMKTLDYHYMYPFPFTPDTLRYGPVSWNFYQYLFIKHKRVYYVNKSPTNPLLLLIQSGQFGIFIDIFNNSFTPENYNIRKQNGDPTVDDEVRYLGLNEEAHFDTQSYYNVYDKLIKEAVKTDTRNKISAYQKIIRDNYRGEIVFKDINLEKEFDEQDYLDVRPRNFVVNIFTYLYRQVRQKLVNDDLVYLHNSAFFIHFIKNYTKNYEDVESKFNYFKRHFNGIKQNIEMSKEAVREFLTVQYTWIIISMFYTHVNFKKETSYRFFPLAKRINMHLMLYLHHVIYELSTFRRIPKTKLLQNIFGKNVETTDLPEKYNRFNKIQYCDLQYYEPDPFNFRTCTETVIMNVLRYVLRHNRNQNRIDKNKLKQLSTNTDFHKKIVKFFKPFIVKDLYGLNSCETFARLLQDIPAFRNDDRYYGQHDSNGSYDMRPRATFTILTYIVYGEVYENAEEKFREWCKRNGVVVTQTIDGKIQMDDLLTVDITRCGKHTEVKYINKVDNSVDDTAINSYLREIEASAYKPDQSFLSNLFLILTNRVFDNTILSWDRSIENVILISLIGNYDNYVKKLQRIFPTKYISSIYRYLIKDILRCLDFHSLKNTLPKTYYAKTVSILTHDIDEIEKRTGLIYLIVTVKDVVRTVDRLVDNDEDSAYDTVRDTVKDIVSNMPESTSVENNHQYVYRLLFIMMYYIYKTVSRAYKEDVGDVDYYSNLILSCDFLETSDISRINEMLGENASLVNLLIVHLNGLVEGYSQQAVDALKPYANPQSFDYSPTLLSDLSKIINYVLEDLYKIEPILAKEIYTLFMRDKHTFLLQDMINVIIVRDRDPKGDIVVANPILYDSINDWKFLEWFKSLNMRLRDST